MKDLRHAVRTLRRQPAFVAAVVGTYALAIGTNAAMLGLIDRLMLAPPPGITRPERLVRLQVEETAPNGESYRMSSFSYPLFQSLDHAPQAFAAVAAMQLDTVMVGRAETLRPSPTLKASGKYFTLLGATPEIGRFFAPADDELPLGSSVVVISHAYWTRVFARDQTAIGKELIIDGEPFTIIGVGKRGFNGDSRSPVDLFIPLTAGMRTRGFGWWTVDRVNLLTIISRLADGIDARPAAEIATNVLRASNPDDRPRLARLEPVVPGASARQSTQSRIALWLTGVSIIVLAIATANVGTLLLLRAARRQRETAVRIALGAQRRQLARQLVTESLLLALLGAAAGLLLSRWLAEAIRVTLLPNLAPGDSVVEQRVLWISIGVAAIAGILAALSPILQIGRRDVAVALRAGGEHGASRRLGSHGVLVGLQVALCTVLLVGAGLFVRSLQRVQSQDLGFSTDGILYVTLDFQGFLTGEEKDAVYYDALRRVRSVQGVTRVTVVEAFPFGPFHVPPINVPGHEGMPTLNGQPPFMYGATPDYLKMMKVAVKQGRAINEGDTRSSQLVVLVNESMAKTLWPAENPIGKCVRAGYGAGAAAMDDPMASVMSAPCRQVVGVVRDSRARSLRSEGNETRQMQYYVPFDQLPGPPVPSYSDVNGLFIQAGGDPETVRSTVQRVIQTGLTRPAYARVRAYQDLIDPQLRSWKLGASLFSVFGALALGIAAVGLFGVISYLISQRTREIGVRLALGATRNQMWRMVVLDSLRLVAIGLGTGIVAAIVAAPLVRDLLFHTSPWDPTTLATAALVLLSVTVIASLLPALRAGRVDPLEALRADG